MSTEFIQLLENGINKISESRKEQLRTLALLSRETPVLAFICTHNSRRSQIAEICADLITAEYELELKAFSAGTEATALNHRVVEAFKAFDIELVGNGPCGNPRYTLASKSYYSKTILNLDKLIGEPYIAVMVCDDADANCPIVPGASQRFSLQFKDPKFSDDTAQEQSVYKEKIIEIGTEILYLIKTVL